MTFCYPQPLTACLVLTCLSASAFAEEIRLFNGHNLDGWTCDISKDDLTIDDLWSVADGILFCKGRPQAVLRTVDEYENYRIRLQWRWPERGGNNGLLVHCTKPRELAIWPKSLEVQLAHKNAGDFWVIGTEIDVPNEESRVKGRRHINLTDDSEKPIGEWNTLEVECRGDKVTVFVNGVLVNEGTNSTATSGAICLQAEGTPIEYRDIVLTPLAAE